MRSERLSVAFVSSAFSMLAFGEGTSVAAGGAKFFGKIVEWRVITEQHDIEDLMQVRIALEGVTAAKVALHGTEKDLLEL